ncbi:MAG: glycosyltransferase family 2 protein [Methanosarcinales archaeon]
MYPKVSIVILNWNGWKDTVECLESLFQITYPNYNVIIADNGSEDDSIVKIQEWAEGQIQVESKFVTYNKKEKPIKYIEYTREEAETGGGKEEVIEDIPSNQHFILIKNEKNYGFAEGNNITIRYALKVLKPDYILLLNNDVVVDKEFLNELVKVAESSEKIGIVGAVNYFYDYPKKIRYSGGIMNWTKVNLTDITRNKIDKEQFRKIRDVDEVAGSSLLIKVEVIYKIGLLYSDYFLFFEETEWCVQAKKNNYAIYANLNSKIWHKGSASTSTIPGVAQYYLTRNRFLFMKRNATNAQIISFLIYFLVIEVIYAMIHFLLFNRNVDSIKQFYKGIYHGLGYFQKETVTSSF